MKNTDVIRAWKNEEYRLGLSEEERTMLPVNPAGAIELNDTELATIGGASILSIPFFTISIFGGYSWCKVGGCPPKPVAPPK